MDLFEWIRKRGTSISGIGGERDFRREAFIRSMIRDAKNRVHLGSPLLEIPYVIFDLETTGFRPYHGDEILSIGAVRMDGGKVLEEPPFHTYVRTDKPVPEEITRLTGITPEDVKGAPFLQEALAEWLRFIERRTLVAYGAGHDTAFIQAGLKKSGAPKLTHRVIDGWQIIRFLHREWPDHSLDTALDRYGIPICGRHTADGDSIMTAVLWGKILQTCRERQIRTLEDLYSRLSQTR
ncbi:exonuclease domain-containing protein [Salinithrix halophila]|uniref:Exonuclease domain-containing protein n=1 Tax=Salinithrix halophila TaxID=1485204 RepID=A0ABV8JMG5_9BACL